MSGSDYRGLITDPLLVNLNSHMRSMGIHPYHYQTLTAGTILVFLAPLRSQQLTNISDLIADKDTHL